ncbi:PREDICTED: uncharacterized protein LOC105559093 [Vollenhovia emeryi]|uniref:uncharacterized protein LOC105559093 n=1 Tax=Vollenhovia emeryi TaxID=411798 RepID=UPI0005F39348|nr:PREDICTED: uncharacterized protein LOC105559093 [Vollenhovia emeryi]
MDNDSKETDIKGSIEDDKEKRMKALLLLKRKMCKTHDLITQYSEKMKETNYLKSNLENLKKEDMDTISKYKAALDNMRKLDVKVVAYKERNKELEDKVNDYEIHKVADKQIIQQLTYKIAEVDGELSTKVMEHELQKSSFEDRIEELEIELKQSKMKSTPKKKEKKILSTDFDTSESNIDTTSPKSSSDVGINVSLGELSVKREVQDKSVMTDEFYNIKDDPHPLFCAKCETHLPSDLTPEMICKTMSAYPELLSRDLSPPLRKTYLPPCSLSSTYMDSVNRNNNHSRTSVPQLSPYSSYSESIADNSKSQSGRSSSIDQISENVELSNVDISCIPVVAGLSNNLGSVPTALALSQNRTYARQDLSSDLLTEHSSSIKDLERKFELLENKMKRIQRLKAKDNNSCCRRSINGGDNTLNSNLISIICKGMAEYYDEKRQAQFKNKRLNNSKMCIRAKRAKLRKRQLLNTSNACKNISHEPENEDRQVRDMSCNTENATMTTDILSREHTLSVKDDLLSNVNTSSTFRNGIGEFDKREFVHHEKSILHSTHVESVENNSTISRLSTDETCGINAKENVIKTKAQNIHEDKGGEIYASDTLLSEDNVGAIDTNNRTKTGRTSLSNDENFTDNADDKIVGIDTEGNEIKDKDQNIHEYVVGETHANNNLSNKSNVKVVNMDNDTETGMSCNENSTDHADGKVIDIVAGKNLIKSKGQDIHKDKDDSVKAEGNKIKRKGQYICKSKVGDRILKNLRILKRASHPNKRINKQDTTDLYSDYSEASSEHDELAKKSRIENEEDSCDLSLEKIRNLKRNLDTRVESREQEDNKLCSDDYEPARKRIAHTPKTPVLPLSVNETNYTHSTIRSIATVATRQVSRIQRLDTCASKVNLSNLTESNTSRTITKKCEGSVEFIETNSIAGRKPINEKNLALTTVEDRHQHNDVALSTNNIDCDSEFEKSNDVPIEDTINKSVSMDRVIGETSSNGDEPNVLHNNIANDSESIPMKTITQSKSSTLCKDSKCDRPTLKIIEMRKVKHLESTWKVLGNKSHDDHEVSKDAISNGESSVLHGRSNLLETMRNKSCNNSDTSDGTTEVLRSPILRDSGIVENINDSNVKESLYETKNSEGEETFISNKTIRIRSIEIKRNACANQQRKTKFIDTFNHLVKESQSDNNSETADEATEVLCSPSLRDSGVICDDSINDSNTKESVKGIKNTRNKREETCVNNETIKVQAIQTRKKNISMSQQDKETKSSDVSQVDEKFQTPMSKLMEYIKPIKKHKLSNRKIKYICKITDQFVKNQLKRLISSAWEETIHDNIVQTLGSTCRPRIIAKCIVEFLLEDVDHDELVNKSFTPPAPPLTTFEQKIVALLFDLEALKPTVIYFVQAGIEYNLFRLNSSVTKVQIDTLTRVYVVLSRIQKDREKIRMICCNALYGMGGNSIGVLYTAITSWPEVIPNSEANKEILPRVIVFLIRSMVFGKFKGGLDPTLDRLLNLKRLLTKFYNYNCATEETEKNIVKDLMTALKAKRMNGLDTAIILVAKREGPASTYNNIIKSNLLPMIINNEHPCVYSAFSLLGRLLRAFPQEDKDNIVRDISEQLCDLINSGQGSHDQQEGIISALISLSRHKFEFVAPSVIKWTPGKALRPILNTQLQSFINLRNSQFWKIYLNKLNEGK